MVGCFGAHPIDAGLIRAGARTREGELLRSLRGSRVRRSVVYARLTRAQARLTVQDAYPTRIQRIQPYPGVSGSIGDRI